MTEREKMAQIIAEYLCPQGKAHARLYGAERVCYSRDNFAECEKVSECVDALIAAGFVEVPHCAVVLTPEERAEEMRLANEELKKAVRECAASIKLAFYYEFDELIPSTMADKIDKIVKEVLHD